LARMNSQLTRGKEPVGLSSR